MGGGAPDQRPGRGHLPCEAAAPGRPRCPAGNGCPPAASSQPRRALLGTSCSSRGEGASPCWAPASPPRGGCLHFAPEGGRLGMASGSNQCSPARDTEGRRPGRRHSGARGKRTRGAWAAGGQGEAGRCCRSSDSPLKRSPSQAECWVTVGGPEPCLQWRPESSPLWEPEALRQQATAPGPHSTLPWGVQSARAHCSTRESRQGWGLARPRGFCHV